jgi:hypothetical protein
MLRIDRHVAAASLASLPRSFFVHCVSGFCPVFETQCFRREFCDRSLPAIGLAMVAAPVIFGADFFGVY